MRKYLKFLFVFVALVMTFGCSKSTPNTVDSDIEEQLALQYPFIKMEENEIIRSDTEDKEYCVQVSVKGSGEYADYIISGMLSYYKYDQGFELENTGWTVETCTITKYPTKEEALALYNNLNLYGVESYSYVEPAGDDCTHGDGDCYYCVFNVEKQVNTYIGKKGEIEVVWEYDAETGEWKYAEEYTDVMNSLLKNIEGKYTAGSTGTFLTGYESNEVTISNQTENTIDVMVTYEYAEYKNKKFTLTLKDVKDLDRYNSYQKTYMNVYDPTDLVVYQTRDNNDEADVPYIELLIFPNEEEITLHWYENPGWTNSHDFKFVIGK